MNQYWRLRIWVLRQTKTYRKALNGPMGIDVLRIVAFWKRYSISPESVYRLIKLATHG